MSSLVAPQLLLVAGCGANGSAALWCGAHLEIPPLRRDTDGAIECRVFFGPPDTRPAMPMLARDFVLPPAPIDCLLLGRGPKVVRLPAMVATLCKLPAKTRSAPGHAKLLYQLLFVCCGSCCVTCAQD